jgi:peptidoglycan hydrolase CwlO-like protein
LQRSQSDLVNLQSKLHQTEYYAQQYQYELERLQSQLQQTQQCIKAMESSKFWKMRNAWFKLKGLIIK